jgi:hypothetical protein
MKLALEPRPLMIYCAYLLVYVYAKINVILIPAKFYQAPFEN